MTENQLIFLANAEPAIGRALVKVASEVEKLALSNSMSQFNETVPSQQQKPDQQSVDPTQVQGQQNGPAVDPSQIQDPNALPQPEVDPMQVPAGVDPVSLAQQFLAPIFDAAASGDQNAASVIAKATAEIMKTVADGNAQAQQVTDQMQVDSGLQMPAEYAGVITPEQQQQAQAFANTGAVVAPDGSGAVTPAGAPANAAAADVAAAQAGGPQQPQVGTGPEMTLADQIIPQPESKVVAKPKAKGAEPKTDDKSKSK